MSNNMDQRFAPPQAHVEDLDTSQGTQVLAGRGVRLASMLVDWTAVFVVLMVLAYFIPGLATWMAKDDARQTLSLSVWNPSSLILGLGAFMLVHGWTLLKRGQTLGKILFKLRIVRTDGSPADAWRLLGLRYGIGFVMNMNLTFSMLYGLLDSLLIFRQSRQCLHDTIADTKVIKL